MVELPWVNVCLVRLIKWRYANVFQLHDLQQLEYNPGRSFCKFGRLLAAHSNTAFLLAMSFAVVTANSQYVNKGAGYYAANLSEQKPVLGTTVVTFKNHQFSTDMSLEYVTPLTSSVSDKDDVVVIDTDSARSAAYDRFSTFLSHIASNSLSEVIDRSKKHDNNPSLVTDELLSNRFNDYYGAGHRDREDFHEAAGNTSLYSSLVSESDIASFLLSVNDSEIATRFGNRTPPHLIESSLEETAYFAVLSVVLGLMILITIVGNVFVIAAILIEKNLQNVANYLIVSLAVADLMVACLVMPLGAVYEISDGWVLGPELCDMWTASDVLCCTASILHLVAIALDRYWAVTDVEYVTRRSAGRIVVMIIIIWTVALIVSLAPQFGWKDPGFLDRINLEKRCLLSQDIGYQIFATCATFYVPLLAILVLYWKIFQAARRRIRKRALRNPANGIRNVAKSTTVTRKRFNFFNRSLNSKGGDDEKDAETGLSTNIALMDMPSSCSAAESSQENSTINNRNASASEYSDVSGGGRKVMDHISVERRSLNVNSYDLNLGSGPISFTTKIFIESPVSTMINKQIQKVKLKSDKKQSIEAKREKKAAKTLAIITGAFVICWLPFFVMALFMPMCPTCHINRYVSSFFLWLGYFNSTLNPIIYTIFSPEFRQAFNRILCGIHNGGWRNR